MPDWSTPGPTSFSKYMIFYFRDALLVRIHYTMVSCYADLPFMVHMSCLCFTFSPLVVDSIDKSAVLLTKAFNVMDYSRKYPHTPHGRHLKFCKKFSVSITGNPQISPNFANFNRNSRKTIQIFAKFWNSSRF